MRQGRICSRSYTYLLLLPPPLPLLTVSEISAFAIRQQMPVMPLMAVMQLHVFFKKILHTFKLLQKCLLLQKYILLQKHLPLQKYAIVEIFTFAK
jgi:hypothetical protein